MATRSNRALWIVLALCAAPVIASYVAYYWIRPQARTNYGELLAPRPAPELRGTTLDGRPFALSSLKGKWVLLQRDPGACVEPCQRRLYASRQARTIQNTEAERIVRVWLLTDATPPDPRLVAAHPDLVRARIEPGGASWLPRNEAGGDELYLIDPLGNLMMRFPADPDIKAMAKDFGRLLKASRIG